MTVYVLHVEGNTDYYSEVLGVYATEDAVDRAHRAAMREVKQNEHIVEGEGDETDDFDWTRKFNIEVFEVKQ